MLDSNKYQQHADLLIACANEILAKHGKTFVIDDGNRMVLRFLLYYFNRCEVATEVFPNKGYDLNKNIMLAGPVGSGKTLLMDAFSLYLRRTNNPMWFRNISVTELLNYYKLTNTINPFTYNICDGHGIEGDPQNVCLNDVGLQTQQFYGNDTKLIIQEFFHARNEIFVMDGKNAHITTNLDVMAIKREFHDEYDRLVDRFKTYNVLHLSGASRR